MSTYYSLDTPQSILETQYVIIDMLNQVRKKLVEKKIPNTKWLLSTAEYNQITDNIIHVYCKNFTFLYSLSLAISCRQNYLEKNSLMEVPKGSQNTNHSVMSLLSTIEIHTTPTLFEENNELVVTLLNEKGEQLPRGYLNIFLYNEFFQEIKQLVADNIYSNNQELPPLLVFSHLVSENYLSKCYSDFIFITQPIIKVNNYTDCMVTENIVEKLEYYETELMDFSEVNPISYLIESFYYQIGITDTKIIPRRENNDTTLNVMKNVSQYLISNNLFLNGINSSNTIFY